MSSSTVLRRLWPLGVPIMRYGLDGTQGSDQMLSSVHHPILDTDQIITYSVLEQQLTNCFDSWREVQQWATELGTTHMLVITKHIGVVDALL
jgi:hypothetical protein